MTNENRPKIRPNRNVDFYNEAIKVKDLKAKFLNEDLQAQFNYLEMPSPFPQSVSLSMNCKVKFTFTRYF